MINLLMPLLFLSVLQDKAHLVFVLLFCQDLGGVRDPSHFFSNLLVSSFELGSRVIDRLLNFLFNRLELSVLLLYLQNFLQFIDFGNLINDLLPFVFQSLDHGQVQFVWLILLKHFIDRNLYT